MMTILHQYVLDCIGSLTPDERDAAGVLVRENLGGGGDWKLTVRRVLALGDTLDDEFRLLWREYRMTSNPTTRLSPNDFARRVVQDNIELLIP
jgi:hypothetical protein